MNERLVLVKGNKVSIVAQDKHFGDAEGFAFSRSDAVTLANIGAYGRTYDAETVAKYMPDPSLDIGDKRIFTIIANDDGRYLGDIRLERIEDSPYYQIGIVIINGERNKGFGSEALKILSQYAFECLNVDKLYLRVYQNNPKAKKLYMRLGFSYEKTTDDGYEVDGIHYLEDWLFITSAIA